MIDFFTRRYDDKYKYSIYYFENKKQMICKAKRTIFTFSHNLSLEIDGVEKYRVIRTKGNAIAEILMTFIKNFIGLEFTIFMNNTDSVGNVYFKSKKSFELVTNESTYFLVNHKGGYFSIKKNGEQIALLKREPVAKCLYNRYCVWYETKLNDCIDILLLILSINDYMFYCNDWGYNTKKDISSEIGWEISDYASIWPSFKNVTDIEVKWRPSDSNNENSFNDNLYLKKIDLLQKKVNKFSVFVVMLLVLLILITIIIKLRAI